MGEPDLTRLIEALSDLAPPPGDGEATADLRRTLNALPADQKATVRAVLGRVESAGSGPLHVHGGLSALLAADRFGLGFERLAKAEDGLKQAAAGARVLMDLAGVTAWWGRLLALPEVRVIGALPDTAARLPQALMIGRSNPEPTGDDRTFWVTDSPLPETRLVEVLGLNGLAAAPLISTGGLKLMMIAGYVQADDGRLDGLPGTLTGVIGAAPLF
ncbi:MAG: hypothetical protein Q8S53_04615 [Brevundimonas sp.]|uniref:hypothetical protein n=1 Tax=Brevundimonas sp. TaxID=1871086 RepID=UPI0027323C8A|nr:hypothetical protein [Brevundimonas sp.]MDP3377625.1 hypothetical protein [Brevundimonas sp.]